MQCVCVSWPSESASLVFSFCLEGHLREPFCGHLHEPWVSGKSKALNSSGLLARQGVCRHHAVWSQYRSLRSLEAERSSQSDLCFRSLPTMARTRSVLPALLIAAVAACAVLQLVTAFVAPRGVSAPMATTPGSLRGQVAMQARGGAEEPVVADPNSYIIGMSLFMIVSVAANTNGFFGPW